MISTMKIMDLLFRAIESTRNFVKFRDFTDGLRVFTDYGLFRAF
jgi:hypothetical protein